jgi:hypothetical protein
MAAKKNKSIEVGVVKIGFADIKIERVDASFSKSNTDWWGEYLSRQNKIEIQTDISELDYANTLLHEILHACVYLSSLNADGGVLKEEESEEQVVNTIANWLLAVFRDNPKLLDIFKSAVT